MFCSNQVQRRCGPVGADGVMRFVDEARHRLRQPVVAARGACFVAHSLLDDAPVTRPRKKEGMVVKLVPILHSSAVDFGGHAARIQKRGAVDGQPVAPLTNLERSLTGSGTLTPLGVNAEVVFDTAETLLERTGHRGGNSAGMPIETEYTAECLEPERIGQATEQLLGTAIDNHMRGNFACKPRHPREEPRGGATGM